MPSLNRTSLPAAPKGFIWVTRLYTKGKTSTVVKKHSVLLAKDDVGHIRPRTTKVMGQKSAIVTKSGKYLNLAETTAQLAALLARA